MPTALRRYDEPDHEHFLGNFLLSGLQCRRVGTAHQRPGGPSLHHKAGGHDDETAAYIIPVCQPRCAVMMSRTMSTLWAISCSRECRAVGWALPTKGRVAHPCTTRLG